MSNHEQPTPSHPKSDVRNTVGKNKQTPQGSARTTSAVDLEEFCEKHYEKLLPIMADKYEYEQRKKEKLEEVKARLEFGEARKKTTRAQESAYSESRTMSPRRQRRSRSPRHNPSVFTRLRRERSRSPRHEYKDKARREGTVFKRLGSRGRSTSVYSDNRQESSRYTKSHSESEDSEGGHWKSKSRRKKSSVEDDDLSQPWVNKARVTMSSATSDVTYTSVYTDSEPGRAFWGADYEGISEGGIPRVIVLGYDGLPLQPVAPPSPDFILGPENPQTPPVPQEEDEREPMFIQAHDPNYVPEPIYPEYIPLEDDHEFPAEEQPLPPIDSPTTESPGYVTESDPEEDPEGYEDDETEDGPVDYPMDGGDDGDDDDGDSSRDDARDEDEDEEDEEDEEEEEEHLAPADSTTVIPADEPVFPPEGTEPVIPPPSTDITIGARITVRPQTSISLPPEAEVERLLAMTTPSPSPPISLSPPSAGERLARCTAPPAHSPPLPPSSGFTAALPPPPLPPLPPSLSIPSPVDRRDDIPESEQPPRKSRAEERRQGIKMLGTDLRDTGSGDLLMGIDDSPRQYGWWRIAYASREAWARTPDTATAAELLTSRTQHQVTRDCFQMQQLSGSTRETDRRRQDQMVEALRVIRDMRREMSDMQAELLALREPQRRARQPGPEARIPDHQEASGDADSHKDTIQIMAPTTRGGPNTHVNDTNPNNMTPESVQAMIDQALLRNSTNGDGSHSSHGDNRRNVQTARPCFYADFMKCQPLNFKGAEGVVGLTRWIEKMESVFNISGCAVENQVKFATCTLLGAALTWWNGQIRTLGPEAYAMTWEVLKKKMTDKYCPQGEIKKLEIELWNLKVKGNDVPAYTERFQELTLICTKFVANETEKVDKYLSGLPDNIYGNVKAAKPKTLDETIELANDLMDRKLLTYAERQSDNKRRADDSSRNNHGHQQQPFKRQNVAKVYNMGTGERKPYGGSLPKCNKCHLHHNGPCTQRCHKCNKIGHFARDCRSTGNTNVANTQKGNGATPKGNVGNAEKRGNAPGNPDANIVTVPLINIAQLHKKKCYDVESADGGK
ncbi:reverse transcriptase domain-containing protein [Tanacetum coccineum]